MEERVSGREGRYSYNNNVVTERKTNRLHRSKWQRNGKKRQENIMEQKINAVALNKKNINRKLERTKRKK